MAYYRKRKGSKIVNWFKNNWKKIAGVVAVLLVVWKFLPQIRAKLESMKTAESTFNAGDTEEIGA